MAFAELGRATSQRRRAVTQALTTLQEDEEDVKQTHSNSTKTADVPLRRKSCGEPQRKFSFADSDSDGGQNQQRRRSDETGIVVLSRRKSSDSVASRSRRREQVDSLALEVAEGVRTVRQKLQKGEVDDALEAAEAAFQIFCRARIIMAQLGPPRDTAEEAAEDQGEFLSPRRFVGSVSSPRTPKTPKATTRLDAGPVCLALVMCYSKAHDWEAAARYATYALEPEGEEYGIKHEQHLADLRLRRAIALLGGMSLEKTGDGENSAEADVVQPGLDQLNTAEEDLYEVMHYRPKDPTAMHGLKVVAFLRKQALSLRPPEQRVRGLDRVRTAVRP